MKKRKPPWIINKSNLIYINPCIYKVMKYLLRTIKRFKSKSKSLLQPDKEVDRQYNLKIKKSMKLNLIKFNLKRILFIQKIQKIIIANQNHHCRNHQIRLDH